MKNVKTTPTPMPGYRTLLNVGVEITSPQRIKKDQRPSADNHAGETTASCVGDKAELTFILYQKPRNNAHKFH